MIEGHRSDPRAHLAGGTWLPPALYRRLELFHSLAYAYRISDRQPESVVHHHPKCNCTRPPNDNRCKSIPISFIMMKVPNIVRISAQPTTDSHAPPHGDAKHDPHDQYRLNQVDDKTIYGLELLTRSDCQVTSRH